MEQLTVYLAAPIRLAQIALAPITLAPVEMALTAKAAASPMPLRDATLDRCGTT